MNSLVEKKRLRSVVDIVSNPAEPNDDNILYRHSALCQTYLPYRNPGEEVTEYTHRNGNLVLSVDCTRVTHPDGTRGYLGLPFGPKARLSMLHIDTMAILQQSPEVEVEDSMTRFVTEGLGLSNSGYNIRKVREQMSRLAACMISVAKITDHGETTQVKQFDCKLIEGFDLWFPKDVGQKTLWTSTIQLNNAYFETLMAQAIPHDMRMVAALSNNAMALDILSWLTQRLHRVDRRRPTFVSWQNLKNQFGSRYRRMADFKRDFRKTLKEVIGQYRDARVEELDNRGFNLYHSKPPIPFRPTPLLP